MIKTQTNKIMVFATCILVLCLVFFNLSCGLDIIEYYEPPYVTINPPEPENIDSNQKYISFRTNNSENTSISFKGTNVFYKIYNNREDARNDRDRLKSISQNDYSGTSAETLITNYKYAMLNNSNILCPKSESGSDYDVRIDFTDSNKFALIINGDEQKPLRAVENYEFNFDSSYWTYDNERDFDVKYNSSSATDVWYVQFFAASIGLSSTLNEQYSNIVYLGCISL
ncbi:MAG: hypothetical protein SOW31_03770 [Treponema sp.]|nr:hypothetical protein [Spirochaetia bacterium]MDY3130825.1 hypothetical protein [Treponema sp.]